MQAQIQALLAGEAGEGEEVTREAGREAGAEVAKHQIFDGMLSRVAKFITVCKLYIKMRMREEPVDPVICAERNSRYVERECNGGVRNRGIGIRVSRGIFDKFEEGIWWRRRGVGESSGAEKVGTRGKNNGRIYTRI